MNKLAIVGLGKGYSKAPWRNAAYDCWTMNSFWTNGYAVEDLPRLRAWFELHSRRYLKEEWQSQPTHIRALKMVSRLAPVMMYVQRPQDWPELGKAALPFPRAELQRAFPRGDYHASTFDWMLAFAIHTGYTDIHFWGVNLGPTDVGEPLSARACLEYWIGVAEGRGVKVTVHEPTGLFWIYNYARERTPYHYDDSWRLVEPRVKPPRQQRRPARRQVLVPGTVVVGSSVTSEYD